MSSPQRVIVLLDHEHNLLRDLVEAEMVPDGQFIRRWNWWRQLVSTFNQLTERSFSPEQLHHYVMTLRKRPQGRLPRWEALGDGCAKMPGTVYANLSEEDRAKLSSIYKQLAIRLGHGSDSILVNAANRRELANMFAAATGNGINDRSLIAALIDLRKHGFLPKLGRAVKPKRRSPFKHFDEAGEM